MNVFIVYAHPSEDSFTRHVKESFIRGLEDAGHSYLISDLYQMNFKTDMSEAEYLRESNYRDDLPVPMDVKLEQVKINGCDAIVFVYPVFWTEAPAKLVGWFDRVWTYGFAYGNNRTMKQLAKGLVLCVAGNTLEKLIEMGHYESMKTVMLGDRLSDRVTSKEMIVLERMSKEYAEEREGNWDKHLETAYQAAYSL
ncbi:NAD(P)H-dependent oxidoreductase [Gorillibacterium timonense]|uniref:NAD(P)H-dependent oxidoreductase n=1 Tax=Gorillibacterium timonense TaxID=1689269 RepID=UPI00071D2643|nr:NAD(P)H-dependent oxidoreductase [Gorillibacterium timonense]